MALDLDLFDWQPEPGHGYRCYAPVERFRDIEPCGEYADRFFLMWNSRTGRYWIEGRCSFHGESDSECPVSEVDELDLELLEAAIEVHEL